MTDTQKPTPTRIVIEVMAVLKEACYLIDQMPYTAQTQKAYRLIEGASNKLGTLTLGDLTS